jgi:hypothetical protein
MNHKARMLKMALLAALVAILVAAAVQLRQKKQAADLTAGDIEDQLAALDPVTRAAVVAKLSTDSTKHVRAMHG